MEKVKAFWAEASTKTKVLVVFAVLALFVVLSTTHVPG